MWAIKFLFFAIICREAFSGIRISEEKIASFKNRVLELKNDLDEQKISTKAARIIESIPISSRKDSSSLQFYACNACQSVIDEFMYIRRVELFNDTDLIEIAIDVCSVFEFQSEKICSSIINYYAPTIIYIIDNRPDLTADTVCKFLLNDGDCANPYNDNILEFSISIDDSSTNKIPEVMKTNNKDLVIVHITDIHVDLKYQENSLAKCKDFACCRDNTIKTNTTWSQQFAGFWGSYHHCDTPLRAVENAFRQIVKQHPKIDAVYFTGDVVDHHIYDTTIDGMKNSLSAVYNLINEIFGQISVYPILGNHENQNLFAPLYIDAPSYSTQWLYDHVVDLWKNTLTNDSLQTVKDGGYYTELIKPGLRIIALNNNLCFIYNFWLLFDVEPIREQFQWLHDTLLEAEEAGERVHILAHIPSGIDTYHEICSREYQKIVERFHKIIAAQFNGHTEFFEFYLTYKTTNISNPIALTFNGGALASYSRKNRNYIVYNVSGGNFEVTDAELWTYNLTLANEKGKLKEPLWFRQFSLRKQFNLLNLSVTTMNELFQEMAKNSSIFDQYWRMKIKNSDLFLEMGCDSECFHDTLCEIITSDNTNAILCDNLMDKSKQLH
ncbi:hypothetical protein PVAND_003027 [Polypedilum vanderplanki]|uniref:Sphingomyelin phosphodiesterase n=1 Tax=Polypedilum vanderplanki TaxID=319348 RepID=A0A9J6BST8_POLVA|nr:hypothetical protein PVAND_003027 [Polypedilum vanderplanki]